MQFPQPGLDGSTCPDGETCCDTKGTGAAGDFDCCSGTATCTACDSSDACSVVTGQTHICKEPAAPSGCPDGQGKQGAAYKESADNSYADCDTTCQNDDACVAFDFTVNAIDDACRLYNDYSGVRTDAGGDDRSYCVVVPLPTADPTATPPAPICPAGQGKKGAAFKESADNSYAACEEECHAEADCVAFDYTTTAKDDACRLYSDDSGVRTDAGGDDRYYCADEHTDDPTATPPTDDPTAALPCPAGQGKKGAAFMESADNSYAACEEECHAEADCVAFDYTTTAQDDACRLYTITDTRTDGGRDNRFFCVDSHNVADPLG